MTAEAPFVANGFECMECGDARKTTFMECDRGLSMDEDHPGIPVIIEACPNGVTVADWQAGNTAGCDSDDHEWKSGNHIRREES